MKTASENTRENSSHSARIPLLELSGINRVYGSNIQTTALDSIDLVVERGDFLAIVGPSGSGKSTLLNIIGLLDSPSSGTYRIRGKDTQLVGERARNRMRSSTFGFVFQASHIIGSETVATNAALALEITGVPRHTRAQRVDAALTLLGMKSQWGAIGKNLSGGERQRVSIARAIASNPDIILADEPTGALDSHNSDAVIDHLEQLNKAGATVIIITHDLAVAARARKQVILQDGRLISPESQTEPSVSAPPPELVNTPEKPLRRGTFARVLSLEFLRAISAHTSSPGRALVLILAFVLGAGGLVSALGTSQSAAAQVSERLSAAALDEVGVTSSDIQSRTAGDQSFHDAKAQLEHLNGVKTLGRSAVLSTEDAQITLLAPDSFLGQPTFLGTRMLADSGFLQTQGATLTPTNAGTLLDDFALGPMAIVGVDAAKDIGLNINRTGGRIWVAGRPVEIAGFLTDSTRNSLLKRTVIISYAAAGSLAGYQTSITVRTVEGYPAALATAIPLAINPGNPGSIQTTTVADLRSLRRGVAQDLGAYISAVSWLLVALSSLSAGTAMFLSVRSRAPEIALRRALGASRAAVWRLFALEGAVVGAAGGIAGAAVGLLAIIAVCQLQGWTPILSGTYVAVGVSVGVTSGLISAIYPALVAAFSNPADAIRG